MIKISLFKPEGSSTSKLFWSTVILFCTLTSWVFAQNQDGKTITGSVSSAVDGSPLPGVNVIVKGTRTGNVTDFNGKYSVTASANDVLIFSYLGFKTQEVPVQDQISINVVMEENLAALGEVVVVGYGSQRKSDLTGSVAVVDTEEAKKTITPDVAKMLQGQVPGVTVQSSGEPGGFVNIKIRGITSFNNNNPLFVIDGIIVDNPYDFAPGEIESIQVLKDASAAAIYGVRGANGVVIITTKKGKKGKLGITYNSLFGFQTVPRKIPLTNARQYQEITSAAEINAGLSVVPGNDPESDFFIDDVNTDWQDEAYATGTVENHALTFSAGSENINYNLNLDYFKNTSYIQTPQDYERFSTTLNLNGKKGKFSYGSKIGYTRSDKESFNEYLVGISAVNDLLQAIPTMPVYDGNRLGGYGGADNLTQRAITLNVIGFNNLIDNENKRNRFIGNVWGELEVVKGLKYKLRASADVLNFKTRLFIPPSDLGWYYITTNDEASLDISDGKQTRTILDNLLSYELELGTHRFDVLLGWVQERNNYKTHTSRGVGYEPGEISHIEYADAISGGEYENTVTGISYLSRLNYSFNNKYLLTVNFRRDRSSLFNEENNTGDYFSVSGAWKLHNESFIKFRNGSLH